LLLKALPECEKLFKLALQMNGLTDYRWPPDVMNAVPDADLMGGSVVIATRADVPKPVILQ
jgi:hypothetical protein